VPRVLERSNYDQYSTTPRKKTILDRFALRRYRAQKVLAWLWRESPRWRDGAVRLAEATVDKRGKLHSGPLRFRRCDFENWLQSKTTTATAEAVPENCVKAESVVDGTQNWVPDEAVQL